MNRQELIKKYEDLFEKLYVFPVVTIGEVLGDLQQLDEPQTIKLPKMEFEKSRKVTVPLFVVDYITEQKKLGHTLSYSIDACMSDRVAEWYWDNSELFAQAWIFGYKIEQGKRYLVKMKDLETGFNFLNRHKTEN